MPFPQQDFGIQQVQQAPTSDSNALYYLNHHHASRRNVLGLPAHAQSPTEALRMHSASDWPTDNPYLRSRAAYSMFGLLDPACPGLSGLGGEYPATSNVRPHSSNHAFPIATSNTAYSMPPAARSAPVSRPAPSNYSGTTTDDESFHAFWETVLGTPNEPRSDGTTTATRAPKPQSPSPSCYTDAESTTSTPRMNATHLPPKRSTARDRPKRIKAAKKSAAVRELEDRERRKDAAKKRRQTTKQVQDTLQNLVYSEEESARFTQPPSQKQIISDAAARWPALQRLAQKAVDMEEQAKAISAELARAFEVLSRSLREADALRVGVERSRMGQLDGMNAQAKQIILGLCPQVSRLRQDVDVNVQNISNAKAGK